MFAEPTTINKVMLIEDRDTSIQSADDESSLLIRISKALTRKKKTAIDAISNVVEGKFG